MEEKLTLEQIHACLLEILKVVHKFCEDNGLRYSMAYGTLLGAVRHKGFIPWDDDIDLLMPRPDFEKFVATFGRGKVERYRCLYNTDDEYGSFHHFFAKVQDTHTVSLQGDDSVYRFGINLDIFPVDGKPENVEAQRRFERKLSSYAHRLNICGTRFDLLNFHQPLFTKLEAHIFGAEHWVKKCREMMLQYPFENSRYAGAVSVLHNGLREVFDRTLFEDYTTLEFEGCRFRAFTRWDEFLRQQYDDYMQLPPVGKRLHHDLTAYYKN